MIVGIDEVGRGAWAGPLTVAAVLLGGSGPQGLTDSKKLTKKQRARLASEIRQAAVGIGIGWVSARQIDTLGLSTALKLAARQALGHIRGGYDEIIIDGTIALVEDPKATLLPKADLLVPSVSAASIVAKVARDSYMRQLDTVFPGYNFASHAGYGTAFHRKALESLGACPIHRLSFAPLRPHGAAAASALPQQSANAASHTAGNAAEEAVSRYLKSRGHTVVARNWRTKLCEIDIVSRYGDTIYFTEVKYRKSDAYGDGLVAITPKKLRQIEFAARVYAQVNKLGGLNLRLAAAAAAGSPPRVIRYLELG